MNTRTTYYIQAIRGPILLVTVGVLFAIHQAGILSFGRTWPLLIIVIGLMKLLERTWGPGTAPGGGPQNFPPYQGQYRGTAQPVNPYPGSQNPPSQNAGDRQS